MNSRNDSVQTDSRTRLEPTQTSESFTGQALQFTDFTVKSELRHRLASFAKLFVKINYKSGLLWLTKTFLLTELKLKLNKYINISWKLKLNEN